MSPDASFTSDLLIEEEMKDSYLNYAMSVIVSRALPDVRDGLKPSQRRILVAMNDLGLTPRSKTRKCAKIVGETMGNYHPHGDQAIYPTLVRLAQDFASRYLMIDPQGNFGSIDGDPPAAMRYTEARMSLFSTLMLEDLEHETVSFVPNFDETRMEPTVLPSKFPNLLCNGCTGIAVGMATSIPPHNLGEVCDALIAVIQDPGLSVEALLKHLPGPDFPTGGIICGREGIRQAYETGRGLITLRAKIQTEELRGGRVAFIVTEIPYNVPKTKIVERIAELIKEERLQGVSDLRDESDKDGIRIVIELKREADDQVVLNQLYQSTPLQETFSVILIALVHQRPKVLNIRELLQAWIDHRIDVVVKRTRFLLKKAEEQAHVLEGLLIAQANIDEVIALIKAAPTVEAAEHGLVARFTLSTIQAQAILSMQLRRLTGLEREKLQKELDDLRDKIREYKAILADRAMVLDIIREDLYEMKGEHADARRTEISGAVQAFDRADLIAEEDQAVVLSHGGYIKRVSLAAHRKQARGGKGIVAADTKEGDFIEHLFVASTHDFILFFTNLGRVYWQKVYDLPMMARTARGRAVVNLLNLQPGEAISSAIPVRHFDDRFLVMATARGRVKKTSLRAFGNPKRGGIIAIKLQPEDRLIGVRVTSGKDHVLLGTRDGLSIRFSEEDARPMGRTAGGVGGIRLRKGDAAQDLVLVDPAATLLTVCENGYGKRTRFDEYRTQSRNGIGIINIRTSERNGKVVGMRFVREADDIMLITQAGMLVRTPVKGIRMTLRNASGVKLITLDPGDKLVTIARVEKETDEETPIPPAAAAAAAAAAEAAPETEEAPEEEFGKEPEVSEEDLEDAGDGNGGNGDNGDEGDEKG